MLGDLFYRMLWYPLRLLKLVWWNWTIEGLENLPPRPQGGVLAPNHINWTDIHIIGASLPLSHRPWWIAKVEMFGNRLIAWYLKQLHVIPIKRGKRDLSALYAAEEAIKQGALMIIFPEGHRSRTGELQQGHSGAIRMAARTNAPIIPIGIWGTEHGLKGALQRKPIHIKIGKPYYVQVEGKSIPSPQMDVLVDEMMLHIAALLPEQYQGVYRERLLTTKH